MMKIGCQDIYQDKANEKDKQIFILLKILQILSIASRFSCWKLDLIKCEGEEQYNDTKEIDDIPGVYNAAAHTFIVKAHSKILHSIGGISKEVITCQSFKSKVKEETQEDCYNKSSDLVVGESRRKDSNGGITECKEE